MLKYCDLIESLNLCHLHCITKDFGEYQESYYSVQTTEGEQISQLIAGYIDIILKKASNWKIKVKLFELIQHTHTALYTLSLHCSLWCLWLCSPQKQSKDRFGLEGDEESTMLEESVSPKKWVVLMYHWLYWLSRMLTVPALRAQSGNSWWI